VPGYIPGGQNDSSGYHIMIVIADIRHVKAR
jgi:hypothetical protein